MYRVVQSPASLRLCRLPALPLTVLLLFASCEKTNQGVIDPRGLPPKIGSPSIAPSVVNTDTMNVGLERLPGDSLFIPITVHTRVISSSASGIGSVSFSFFKDPDLPLYAGNLRDDGVSPDSSRGDSIFSARIPLTIIRSDIGMFYVELSACDVYDNKSNIVRIPFLITRLNQPPVLSNLTAPDTVFTTTSNSILITVHASDPDGPADIRSVTRTTPNGNVWPLNDSGVNGDAQASDGTYTETVSLVPPPDTGSYQFKFQGFDRSNAGSNVIYHTIVILR